MGVVFNKSLADSISNDRLVENPGVNPDSVITFPDPGSGVNVTQRYAKFLEKTLLLRFDKAHGGRASAKFGRVPQTDSANQVANGTRCRRQAASLSNNWPPASARS